MKKQILIYAFFLGSPIIHAKDFRFYVDNTTGQQQAVRLERIQPPAPLTSMAIPPKKLGIIVYKNLTPGNYRLVASPSGHYIDFMIRPSDIKKLFEHEMFFELNFQTFAQITYDHEEDALRQKSLDNRLIVR